MSVSPSARESVPDQPKVTGHCFYLFDDTDEHTRTLCSVGCAFGPEDHISPTDFAAQRVRDAAPLMLEALQAVRTAWQHDEDEAYDGCDGDCEKALTLWADADRLVTAALTAAQAPQETAS